MIEAALDGLFSILHWKAFLLMVVGIVISSTLVEIPGLARPEFLVEIEVIAAVA